MDGEGERMSKVDGKTDSGWGAGENGGGKTPLCPPPLEKAMEVGG